MKKKQYTDLICKKFCSYYKPGKERMKCGSYEFLVGNLSTGELSRVSSDAVKEFPSSKDNKVKTLACKQCDFFSDGCDYRAGVGSTPCGGYAVVAWLLK